MSCKIRCGLVAKKSSEIHAYNKWCLIFNVLQRWPWHRPARRNSSRPDDSKIPRVITRHGHASVPWHISMEEQPYVRLPLLRQMVLEHCQCHIGVAPTEIYGMSGSISLTRHLLLSSGAVRRNSLRCAPFGPPTVSCVLAHARTCLRQAPPTSRGRGLATSAALHHLLDDMSIKAFILGKRCKKKSFFTPFHQI